MTARFVGRALCRVLGHRPATLWVGLHGWMYGACPRCWTRLPGQGTVVTGTVDSFTVTHTGGTA